MKADSVKYPRNDFRLLEVLNNGNYFYKSGVKFVRASDAFPTW